MSTQFKTLTTTYLNDARRVIVKVGSALLVDEKTGKVRTQWLESLAHDLAAMHREGCTPVVVSSGAIALGRHQLGRGQGRLKLEEKQAAAAIGQIQLATEWQNALALFGLGAAQILLSPDDTETRRRHLNARATIQTLLNQRIIPVVNENDTVATMEIRYGDNDRLAARVAQMISADVLVLLSDIDGLYTADPRQDKSAQFLPEVTQIDNDIAAMAGPAHSSVASGGMITKIAAAHIATTAGCHMVICSGTDKNPINQLKTGGRCTWFRASANPPQARKTWISGGLTPKGNIILDDGAVDAVRSGKSLLPAGISHVDGEFERGDLVALMDQNEVEIARGLSHYSAKDVERIAGSKSRAIPDILGYRGRDEVIHADDLVLTYHATRGKDTP